MGTYSIEARHEHPTIEDLSIEVLSPHQSPKKMQLSVEVDFMEYYTPAQVRKIANWLLKTVDQIEEDHNKDGSLKNHTQCS